MSRPKRLLNNDLLLSGKDLLDSGWPHGSIRLVLRPFVEIFKVWRVATHGNLSYEVQQLTVARLAEFSWQRHILVHPPIVDFPKLAPVRMIEK